jgi:hypothetical protein
MINSHVVTIKGTRGYGEMLHWHEGASLHSDWSLCLLPVCTCEGVPFVVIECAYAGIH